LISDHQPPNDDVANATLIAGLPLVASWSTNGI
jgi:hypothetical protein